MLAPSVGAAQKNVKTIKRNGIDAYERGRFVEAETALSAYRRYKPDDDDVWYPLGVSLYKSNKLGEARTLLEGLVRANKYNDEALLYLGRLEHHENNFEEAAKYYKRFLAAAGSKHPFYASIVDDVRRTGFGQRLGPTSGAIAAYTENLGPAINSAGDDFNPILSPNYQDRIYFSSMRAGVTGGYRDEKGFANPEHGSLRADMYAAQIVDGRWGEAAAMSALLNTVEHEVAQDFAMEGQVLLFFRGQTLFSGEMKVDTFRRDAEQRNLHSPNWQDAPLNAAAADNDVFFFNDTTVFFVSQRAGGYGGFDIYTSTRRDGRWLPATNLGPRINSAYDERSAFLAADGRTLYFSSNRVDRSVGGFDVLRSVFDDRAVEWSEPVNGGLSINTAGDELNFRLALSGLEGYYDSNSKRSGEGDRDIYVAYFKEQLREQQVGSSPVSFHAVIEKARFAEQLAIAGQPELPPLPGSEQSMDLIPVKVVLTPLTYGADDNVETPGNIEKSREVLQFLEQFPESKVVVTAHSDDSDPERFRTYFGIKRAERFANYLIGRGVKPARIQLMSVGSTYPLAANAYNGETSMQGQRLNRRLELHVVPGPDYRLTKDYRDPKVPDFLATDMFEVYRELQTGPIFRVEVATLGQMFDEDTWHRMPAPTIQSDAGSGLYQYSVGAYSSYRSAKQLADEASRRGLPKARVVPYLHGLRLSGADVARFAPAYPELAAYAASLEASPE